MALTDGIVAYYKFDETAPGANASDSVKGVTLANNGTATFPVGKINNGFSGGRFTTTTSSPVTGTSDWSACIWYKSAVTATFKYLLQFGTTGAPAKSTVGLWCRNTNGLEMTDPGGSAYVASTLTSTIDGAWHFIVITKLGDVFTIYTDGVYDNSATVTSLNLGSDRLYIGIDTSLTYQWNGTLDECGFWNRALSKNEVQALYKQTKGNQYPFGSSFNNTLTPSARAVSGVSVTERTM